MNSLSSTESSSSDVDLSGEWGKFIPAEMEKLPRLRSCLLDLNAAHVSHVAFPPKKMTAGSALQHVLKEARSILKANYPCIYKFGFTHSLDWRWRNPYYGYAKDTGMERFDSLAALYISTTQIPSALMEAFLIKEYLGNLPVKKPFF